MLYSKANFTVYYTEIYPENDPDNLPTQFSFDTFYEKYHIFLCTAQKILNDISLKS